ncbi:MAG: PAS domain-containing protein [Rhodospirillaceae bacterium]|nr:PAS domain-containing protein [Rhodospirillaceae bacterium]
MTKDATKALEYWKSKARGARLPSRADIDPSDMSGYLKWVTLVDVAQENDRVRYRMRLQGTGVADMFGRDVTGRWADEIYSDFYGGQLEQVYSDVLNSKKPACLTCTTHHNDRAHAYRRLIMPLAADGRSVDMLLVYFDMADIPIAAKGRLTHGSSIWMPVAEIA